MCEEARRRDLFGDKAIGDGAFGYEPKGWVFPQSAFAETLGICAVFVGPLLENPKTDTTFLLRSPKTEKEQSLTHWLKRELAPRAKFELATLRLTAGGCKTLNALFGVAYDPEHLESRASVGQLLGN